MAELIQAQNLLKKYGDLIALNRVDIAAKEGKITGLIGPDGAGKSSFMKILLGLIRRDEGDLDLFGSDPGDDRDTVRSRAGYMPEVFSLYTDLSVEENLLFSFRIHREKAADFASRRDRLYRFNRLERFAGARAGTLSGGMKQKLALSCALMHSPSLLVLDEPTTGVDPLSRREFWNMLQELKSQGITILVSTPYMEEALLCDSIYMISQGNILSSGNPGTLVAEYPGEVIEFTGTDLAPQILRRKLSEVLTAFPVFLSGRKVHAVLPRKDRQLFSETLRRVKDIPARAELIRPDLEDLFLVSVMQRENK